jgi:flagellar protein FliO/FliZ
MRTLLIAIICWCIPSFSGVILGQASDEGVLLASTPAADEARGSLVIQPKDLDATLMPVSSRRGNNGTVVAVYALLSLVAGAAVLWWFQRRGVMSFAAPADRELKLLETRSLGNRQFLVVVQYGEQKMLLGVAPGVINHLCYLEGSQEPTDPQLPL